MQGKSGNCQGHPVAEVVPGASARPRGTSRVYSISNTTKDVCISSLVERARESSGYIATNMIEFDDVIRHGLAMGQRQRRSGQNLIEKNTLRSWAVLAGLGYVCFCLISIRYARGLRDLGVVAEKKKASSVAVRIHANVRVPRSAERTAQVCRPNYCVCLLISKMKSQSTRMACTRLTIKFPVLSDQVG